MNIHIDFDKIEFEGQIIYKPSNMSCIKWERFWEGVGNPYTESEVDKLEKNADELQGEVENLAEECEILEQEKEDLENECERLMRIIEQKDKYIAELEEVDLMYDPNMQ